MKRWLVSLLVAAGLLVAATYVFFPKSVTNSNAVNLPCNINTMNRFFMSGQQWKKWWPGTVTQDSTTHSMLLDYNGYKYYIKEFKYNAISIVMERQDLEIIGSIFFLPVSIDTIRAEWKYNLTAHNNPISRIHLKEETRRINTNMKDILESMKRFVSNQENIYGMKIRHTWVRDTLVVVTEFSSEQSPAMSRIYQEIDGIQKYIALRHATQTDPPMLNTTIEKGKYITKLGIPVDKRIPATKTYSIKYLVPGRILESEITGGSQKAKEALVQMGEYVVDNHLSSPAIPFQSLVTNRMEQPDTSKWVTRIYYPIF